jgi:hypothetical protein
MHAVVNHLRFAAPVTPETIEKFQADAVPRLLQAGCLEAHVVEVDERHLILVLLFESPESVDRITETIGSPFMREHVVHLLDQPTERSVGEVVATSGPM